MFKGFFSSTNGMSYKDDLEFKETDLKLNRTLVDLIVMPAVGLATGVVCSVLFKNKKFITFFGFGAGLGYAFHYNCKSLFYCPSIYDNILKDNNI